MNVVFACNNPYQDIFLKIIFACLKIQGQPGRIPSSGLPCPALTTKIKRTLAAFYFQTRYDDIKTIPP